jgi:hypothetical protein
MVSEEAKIAQHCALGTLLHCIIAHRHILFCGTHPVTFSVHPRNKNLWRGEIVGRAVRVRAHAPEKRTKVTF